MTQPRVKISQRILDEAIRLSERAIALPMRTLTERVCLIGHEFSEALLLVSGPVATPDYTECLIEWETNTPAYHRVRYKKPGGGWTVTDWTAVPNVNASINLTGL